MIKRIVILSLYLFSLSSFACDKALPTNDVNFCASFKVAATCYCTTSGLPTGLCQDMNALYNRMITVFGTLRKACEYQRYTSTEDCMDNWNCYRFGGVDSRGRLCSSNKQACK
ncbi:hypothetical protein [Legionella fallonii]|uniref:Lipoprotein n=1 Tax=Legionella fallonii LLAP-10 TaxID=1212491 RepID=A0A098G2X0_9GAMM|nr:hypothetical protein [Legionella fallonii]CEG56331.1 conserved exported protein of unknown function [Legionella fallonii LLAP-10]